MNKTPSKDQGKPGNDQEKPGNDQEKPGNDQEKPGNDQETPPTTRKRQATTRIRHPRPGYATHDAEKPHRPARRRTPQAKGGQGPCCMDFSNTFAPYSERIFPIFSFSVGRPAGF